MTPRPGSLFITASLGWGYFFITDTLQVWHVTFNAVVGLTSTPDISLRRIK
jgi:hypothetical protein